jgi:hypothetical protein
MSDRIRNVLGHRRQPAGDDSSMNLAADMGITPVRLRSPCMIPITAFRETIGRRSTYPVPIPVQTNPTTSDLGLFVTNKIYPVGIGTAWSSNGFESQLIGAPRMWGFRLRYSFGK